MQIGDLNVKRCKSGIWLKSDNGALINFKMPITHIRNYRSLEGIYLYTVWEDWFKTDPVLQKFYMHLKTLFPYAIVQSPQCYWYEKSEFLEIKFWIRIDLPN
jgi:hypothetical protein